MTSRERNRDRQVDPLHDFRQFESMRQLIVSFEEGRISLHRFLSSQWGSLDSLETTSAVWIRQYRRQVKNLENLYVNVLDRGATAMDAGSLNEVKHALDEMLQLLREVQRNG